MSTGLTLVQGKKEHCYDLDNGARIFYRRIPLPIFVNLVRTNLVDDRTGKTDWQQVAEKGALHAITRWENVFDEDGTTPAECSDENKLMLPVQVMGAIFGKAIEHLPTNADEAKQYAQELTSEDAADPLAIASSAPTA